MSLHTKYYTCYPFTEEFTPAAPTTMNENVHFVGQDFILAHVLWIAGATDTGKTTISQIIAERYGLQLYNYDQHDLAQVKRLAEPYFRD